jgi:Na+-transporting NADH:ubiquinone oxidoreductase subunit A
MKDIQESDRKVTVGCPFSHSGQYASTPLKPMKSIRIQKGYDLPISGEPSRELTQISTPEFVASLPERIPFVKPRLAVKEGDRVKIGSILFEDKRNPNVKFLSPGGGSIHRINFGKRRVVKEIIIKLDGDEEQEYFEAFADADMDIIKRSDLISAIMRGGCWGLLRVFPFGDIPDPETEPPLIIVNIDSKEPFQPSPEVYLNHTTDLFRFGVNILKKLSKKVHLSITDSHADKTPLNGMLTHIVKGPYPSGEPGVLLYHTKQQPDENNAWTITGQNVLLLAGLLKNGHYPIERTVVVGGSRANHQQHLSTRIGVPLRLVAGESLDAPDRTRFIAGGIFSGYPSDKDSYLGLFETALIILPEGDQKELFGFARPGFQKPSYSRAFLSSISRNSFSMDCGMHGEVRACINCGYCSEVCAVDILPQFTLKSVLAGEVEEALAHGLLDCVSCGLCTYVCPSKIDICAGLQNARDAYYKEIS